MQTSKISKPYQIKPCSQPISSFYTTIVISTNAVWPHSNCQHRQAGVAFTVGWTQHQFSSVKMLKSDVRKNNPKMNNWSVGCTVLAKFIHTYLYKIHTQLQIIVISSKFPLASILSLFYFLKVFFPMRSFHLLQSFVLKSVQLQVHANICRGHY